MTVAWVAVGTAVVGTAASIYSGRQAANAATGAANSANAESARQFNLIRSDTASQRALGQGATALLGRLYGINIPGANGTATESQVGVGQFKPSDLIRLRQSGLSTNDILRLGTIKGVTKASDYQTLLHSGFTTQDLSALQTGTFLPEQGEPSAGGPSTSGPDMSAFFTSPDFQFNLGEGQRAIDRSLAAQGRALSGAGVREGVRYASGMASNEYGNFVNRLMQAAGLGNAATNTSASAGISTANTISNNTMNAGNARASSYLNTGQTIGNTVNGLASNYLLYRYLNPNNPSIYAMPTYAPSVNSGIVGPRD